MPRNPHLQKVLAEIKRNLGIGRTRIYQRAKVLATQAQVKTEMGVYLLAATSGINLVGRLPQEKLDKVRDLLFQMGQKESIHTRTRTRQPIQKSITITVGKTLVVKDPILPEKVIGEAKLMAEEVYPVLYVLENSIRELILRVMRKHGDNWWNSKVPRPIRDEVAKRIADETQNPWHGKRGAHPIFYTDLLHLVRIVQNNWTDFQTIIPSIQWLSQRLEDLSRSRNPAMHMNPLGKRDIDRVKLYFQDWESLITAKRSLIPTP